MGSPSALTLAKMGFGDEGVMELWDHDVVEAHNVATQLYRTSDVGRPKVSALRRLLREFADVEAVGYPEKFAGDVDPDAVYICTVDSMDARKQIWGDMTRSLFPRLYIEARMGALNGAVYCVTESDKHRYEPTLYPSSEAQKLPCTAKAIFFTGMGIGAIIASFVWSFLSGKPVPFETLVSFDALDVIRG